MNIYLIKHTDSGRPFLMTGDKEDVEGFEVVEEITGISEIGLHELATLIDSDLKQAGIHNLVGIGNAIAIDMATTCGSIPAKRFLFALIKGELKTSKFFGEC